MEGIITERVKEDGKLYKLTYNRRKMKTEKIKIDGKIYKLIYTNSVRFEGFPIRGFCNKRNRTIKIRKSLHPQFKKYVLAHEIYHAKDRRKLNTPLKIVLAEIRAGIYGCFKEPVGVIRWIFSIKGVFSLLKFYRALFQIYIIGRKELPK